MKKILLLFVILVFFVLGYGAIQYLSLGKKPILPQDTTGQTSTNEAVAYDIVEVARGLEVPWSIVFTTDDRILVTERPGRIRQIVKGVLQPDPLITFSEVSNADEE